MPLSKAMNILVVDDQEAIRNEIKSILRNLGYNNIDVADDGDLAFAMLKAGYFGFVITDWDMPKMSGLDLLKKIRNDEKFKKLPVLMVTAEVQQDQIMEAIKAGVSNYVKKPFDAKTIAEKIDQIFK